MLLVELKIEFCVNCHRVFSAFSLKTLLSRFLVLFVMCAFSWNFIRFDC